MEGKGGWGGFPLEREYVCRSGDTKLDWFIREDWGRATLYRSTPVLVGWCLIEAVGVKASRF